MLPPERRDTLSFELCAQSSLDSVELNGQKLSAGDGAAVSEEGKLQLVGSGKAQVLLFDLN
jgi:hypothetical protein